MLGLPERPVEHVALRDCAFDFDPNARAMRPAMAEGVEMCLRRGVVARFVKRLTLENVRIMGARGPDVVHEADGNG